MSTNTQIITIYIHNKVGKKKNVENIKERTKSSKQILGWDILTSRDCMLKYYYGNFKPYLRSSLTCKAFHLASVLGNNCHDSWPVSMHIKGQGHVIEGEVWRWLMKTLRKQLVLFVNMLLSWLALHYTKLWVTAALQAACTWLWTDFNSVQFSHRKCLCVVHAYTWWWWQPVTIDGV